MKGSKAFAGAAFIGAGVFLGIGAITGNLGGMLAALFDSSDLDPRVTRLSAIAALWGVVLNEIRATQEATNSVLGALDCGREFL